MRVHRCPKCATKGRNFGFNLTVMALVKCNVQTQFPTPHTKEVKTFPPIVNRGDEASWSGESTMECLDCGHVDRAIEFGAEYFREAEPLSA
jgi:hypothetical protein